MDTITIDHEWTETVEVSDDMVVDGADVLEIEGKKYIKRERAASLVIGKADIRMGLRRSLMIEKQQSLLEEKLVGLENALDMWAEASMRTVMYPSMVMSVVRQEGFDEWPIAFEEFASGIPEEFAITWEETVFKLNPHWIPQLDEESLEEARKKAMSSI